MIKTKSVDLSLPPSDSSDSSSIADGSYADLPSYFVSEIPRYGTHHQSSSSAYIREKLVAKPLRSIEPKSLREHLSNHQTRFPDLLYKQKQNQLPPDPPQSTRVNPSDHRNSNPHLSNTIITHHSNFIPKMEILG